jgi:hypothetical protein
VRHDNYNLSILDVSRKVYQLSLVCYPWFSAMREIVTVALPGRFAERAIPIVAVTVTLALMLWFASYIGYVMETACSGCSMN